MADARMYRHASMMRAERGSEACGAGMSLHKKTELSFRTEE